MRQPIQTNLSFFISLSQAIKKLMEEEWQQIASKMEENINWDEIWSKSQLLWQLGKSTFIVPVMKIIVVVFVASIVMLLVDRVVMAFSLLYIKLFNRKPETVYRCDPVNDEDQDENDMEAGINSANYPMVLVQIPMYNEKEVYQLSIGAACRLSWPADRIIIQVLDDSTDPAIKEMAMVECRKWASKGINIKLELRVDRKGYKAGALKQGMKHSYVSLCEFVAIFDADFQPDPDFLQRTVPFLKHNPQIALVQARWDFVNSKECMLTRIQEMSLSYHFNLEQEVGSAIFQFFGFNGTAGVWRISALNEAGGWKDRTTVEDMDLAVRATIKGWKFVYVGDIKVKSELPSTYKAYRNQQHRWSCGPANLFTKMALEIATNKNLSLRRKFYLIYSFFFVRKILAQLVPFLLYCVILPATVLIPEVQVPPWGGIYLPSIITLLTVFSSPRSLHLIVLWIPFELAMSLNRTKGTLMGLLGIGRVNEWVVTEKLGDTLLNQDEVEEDTIPTQNFGDALDAPLLTKVPKKRFFKIGERIHLPELVVGLYLCICGGYDIYSRNWKDLYFVYLFLQSAVFFIAGFGYIGTFVPHFLGGA